ncbi:glycoside hydrolase family 88 protein [Rossellomorea marisflavi]|uniref:glycoside hydrolase family 88 protein n=1 Tax=Rossellomorea marisflavi TaxID=189381 RepID=UPI003518623F
MDETVENWVQDIWGKIEEKITAECGRLNGAIPYIAHNGKYSDKGEEDVVWWTNGFWGGILWQMYHATGKELYKENAENVELRLDKALEQYQGLHHDVGFMWLHTSVANYRLTGNERSQQRALHAAHLLAGRYNPRGKFIRSWNRDRSGWVIIDSLLNIPLLYWAKEAIGDPRFGFIAEDHANMAMEKLVRKDGSCNHIVALDPETGDLLDTPAGQGYDSGSSWSRGQSWAIYGFALSYVHTGNSAYLDTAKKVAHYFISQVGMNEYIPVVDFRSPKEPIKIDTTAGVCAACGLLEISNHVPELEKEFYRSSAIRILQSIEGKYANWDIHVDGIIGYGSGSYHTADDAHVPIIYGDYFFIEAILRLKKSDFLIW